jgi:ornithine cyclodeaminase
MNTFDVTSTSNLIVTATASTTPLLSAEQIQSGTHITAVGADTPEKQELEPAVLAKADIVVADSISQCIERGDIAHAVREGLINENSLVELGHIISGNARGRTSQDQITVADLTGVAVQDIQIAKAVYQAAQR